MMKDRMIKALKVLIFIIYCVCGFLSVAAFLGYSLAAFLLVSGVIKDGYLLYAGSGWVLMAIATTAIAMMPIVTILFRIAYRREIKKNLKRRLLVYIPWLLVWGEYVMGFVYLAINLFFLG